MARKAIPGWRLSLGDESVDVCCERVSNPSKLMEQTTRSNFLQCMLQSLLLIAHPVARHARVYSKWPNKNLALYMVANFRRDRTQNEQVHHVTQFRCGCTKNELGLMLIVVVVPLLTLFVLAINTSDRWTVGFGDPHHS